MSSQSIDPSSPCYSYVRFSSKRQEEGDSIRRQVEATQAWAQRHGLHLDTSLEPARSISAYRGKNRDLGSLAEFLKQVDSGRVLAGSLLVVESLDRITREDIQPALLLILGLLQKGVRIVQLAPSEMVYDSASDMTAIVLMIVELSRGNSESRVKSDRLSAVWGNKKRQAREGKVMTHRLPAWVRREGDRLVLDPHGAGVVRRIFRLAGSGYGIPSIIQRFEAEGIAPIGGRAKHWTRSYLSIVLKDRRALGEYQPMRGKEPDGDVIADYYPPAVSQEEYDLAQAGLAQRRTYKGRLAGGEDTGTVNVFAGLLKEARTGEPYQLTTRTVKYQTKDSRPGARKYDHSRTRKYHALVNAGADEGRTRAYGVPYLEFEDAILSRLREIDAHAIVNGDRPPDRTATLRARLDGVTAEIEQAQAWMDANGFSPTIGKRVTALEGRQAELAAELAEARREAASPLSETWGQAQNLAEALATAKDPRDVRLRLRSALRRIVEGIWLLVVPRGGGRFMACQVWFAGGKRHRDYIIFHRPGVPPEIIDKEFRTPRERPLDLRKPADAAKLEKALAGMELPDAR